MTTTAIKVPARRRVKTFPVIEIFGPTIQGEGAEAGLPTHFVRLGGCDFRCSWCDTMHAVDPAEVRARATRMSGEEIAETVARLAGQPHWVTVSGGNPALHEFGECVALLQERGFRVAAETQGSLWRDWLATLDRLTISPKPPSSGMATTANREKLRRFLGHIDDPLATRSILKIVCFDE